MGSFPHFDQFGYENQKGEGGKEKGKKEEGNKTYREMKKRKRRFSRRFDDRISKV